jgi:hypothetical protein
VNTHGSTFWGTLLAFALLIPFGLGGFSLMYLYGIAVCSMIAIQSFYSSINLNKVAISFTIAVFYIFLAVMSSHDITDSWELREYVRVPIMLVSLYAIYNVDSRAIKIMLYIISLAIIFDFVILALMKGSGIALFVGNILTMRGMTEVQGGYWRHIGIGGNPNVSSIIYSIFIIVSWHMLFYIKSIKFNTFSYIAISISTIIALYLNVLTFSRTGFIALILSFMFFVKKPLLLLFISLLFCSVLLFVFPSLFDQIINRFQSFSSFDARLDHWSTLFNNYNFSTFLFGDTMFLSVVDNDYLYLLYRFGIFGLIISISIPVIVLWNIPNQEFKSTYLHLLVFFGIAAIPGGSIANPKAYLFLVIFGCILSGLGSAPKKE